MNRIGGRRALQWILWLAVAGIAAFAAWQIAPQYRQVVPIVAPIVTAAEPLPVDLTVEQHRDVLLVRWNPANPSVSGATHGLLSVTDGDFERKIGLNTRDLSSGMARYAPLSRHVSFQLSLFDGPVRGKGSVLFLAREPEPAPKQQKKPVSKQGTGKRPSVTKTKDSRGRRRAEDYNVEHETTAVVRPPPPPPLPVEPAPQVAVIAMQAIAPSPVVSVPPVPPPPAYRVTVTTQPSRGTRFEQVLSRLPWVKRIARAPNPALVRPVHRVDPQIEAPELNDPLDANIEIQVDSSGKVKSARLIDLDQAPGNLEWAALRAAKSWRFEAPKGGQSSWLVLTFRYEPAQSLRTE